MNFDRKALETIFDEVIIVDVLDSGDSAHLTLMKRPELGVTLTKLHCWSLTQYSKCVFMDADTLVSMAYEAVILVGFYGGRFGMCQMLGLDRTVKIKPVR